MRAMLRYHGGKHRLAPWIISRMPEHRVYVEPFGGAASVLLNKPRSYAEVYNDLDGEIVNVFRVMREDSRRLTRELAYTPFARDEYKLAFEPTDDSFEMARRTIIRSFMGFGSNSINRNVKSGFRGNSNKSGTTPAHDWGHYPAFPRRFSRRLRGVVIENKPAAQIIAQHDGPETLFLCDPPYVHSTRALDVMHGDHGYAHEMTDQQHEELAEQLRGIKGMVMLCGYHSELYDRLYDGWMREERQAFTDAISERTEVLWFNRAAEIALRGRELSLFCE